MSITTKKEAIEMKDDKFDEEMELTEEEIEQLAEDIEEFQEHFLISLAGTHKFEIIPSTDESGSPLDKKHYSLLKRECSRLGLKILYRIDVGNKTLIVNPENLKIGILNEEIH
jgi:hypothetical protein